MLCYSRFYTTYLEYFRKALREKDITEVLEEYLFSAKANVGGAGIEGEPKMLVRFFSALVHPLIHTGNGLEFGLLGLVAEGDLFGTPDIKYGTYRLPGW